MDKKVEVTSKEDSLVIVLNIKGNIFQRGYLFKDGIEKVMEHVEETIKENE